MLSISTPNTPNRSKIVTKAILQHSQHSLKRRKLEIISTSLSQFIWFPRFHSLNSMHLLVHAIQFSIYSLHDVTNTLNNPTSLFRALSKVCHFFSISSPNFVNSNNLAKAIVKQFDSNNQLHSFTTIPSHVACYLTHLIHSTKETLILNSHVK